MQSKHLRQPDGFGHAVDVAPFIGGVIDWTPGPHFDAIAKVMFLAASVFGVALRWGADWDRDGHPRERGETDSPHFELASPGAPA
jgi:peptidoglycan L-alanyl-D-glutamate endopeptidase CwlK